MRKQSHWYGRFSLVCPQHFGGRKPSVSNSKSFTFARHIPNIQILQTSLVRKTNVDDQLPDWAEILQPEVAQLARTAPPRTVSGKSSEVLLNFLLLILSNRPLPCRMITPNRRRIESESFFSSFFEHFEIPPFFTKFEGGFVVESLWRSKPRQWKVPPQARARDFLVQHDGRVATLHRTFGIWRSGGALTGVGSWPTLFLPWRSSHRFGQIKSPKTNVGPILSMARIISGQTPPQGIVKSLSRIKIALRQTRWRVGAVIS